MKKLLFFVCAGGILAFSACGPSAEEKAKIEQQMKDSIAAVESARINDSIAQVEKMQQETMLAAQKAAEVSLKMKALQDSLDAANAKVKKQSSTPKSTTPKVNPTTGLPTKAVLTEEEKKLPPATQEKILKTRQKMLDEQNQKK